MRNSRLQSVHGIFAFQPIAQETGGGNKSSFIAERNVVDVS